MNEMTVYVIIGLVVYFLPTFAAYKKSFFDQVFILNLLLGWTGLGWIIALIWGMKVEKKPDEAKVIEVEKTLTQELKSLGELKESGVLNDEEFAAAKEKILSRQ